MLAFALISLVGIGLAALFIRQFVVTEFDAYVLTQRRDALVTQLQNYYTAHGSWDGVGASVSLTEQQSTSDQPPASDGAHPPKMGFFLADSGGTIVLAPVAEMLGKTAHAEDLAAGTPVTVSGATVGTLVTLGPPDGRNAAEARYLARTDLALGVAGVLAVATSLALGFVLAQLITRPVRDLTQAARAIAAGDLSQQVPVRSRDELGLLARQFNQMSADLHHANELRRRMTADIAHDLRTPLTVISGYLEALRDESLRPTPARFAAMHDETQVLMHLVTDLHTLALTDAGELPLRLEPVAPQTLLERAAATFAHAAAQSGVTVTVVAPPDLPELVGDPEQLLRVLRNLIGNALHYTPSGGQVTLEAHEGVGAVVLTVADTGRGIAAEHLSNIFERFYRADESRHQATGGSGLGLAIVRSIVEAHGGKVSAQSVIGHGTTFTISLPLAETRPGTAAVAGTLLLASR
jgi:signal transduction histidine kinase